MTSSAVGSGGFSTTYKATWRRPRLDADGRPIKPSTEGRGTPTQQATEGRSTPTDFDGSIEELTVAVKVASAGAGSLEQWRMEVHALASLDHPNVVRYLGYVASPPNFCLVLEFCEGGDLFAATIGSLTAATIIGPTMVTIKAPPPPPPAEGAPPPPPQPAETTKEMSLAPLAARHALLDAHEIADVALGKMGYEMLNLQRCIAICADKKFDEQQREVELARKQLEEQKNLDKYGDIDMLVEEEFRVNWNYFLNHQVKKF